MYQRKISGKNKITKRNKSELNKLKHNCNTT